MHRNFWEIRPLFQAYTLDCHWALGSLLKRTSTIWGEVTSDNPRDNSYASGLLQGLCLRRMF